MSVALVRDTDFSPYIQFLDAATNQVVALVRMLRGLGSAKISQAKQLNGRLQQIEGDADKLILDRLRDLYSGRHEVTRVLVLQGPVRVAREDSGSLSGYRQRRAHTLF